ncbi:MAG: type II toxin-antitoxin system HicA family toxin [Carboxydocellales bacterium]
MKAYSSREVIKILKKDGWILKGIEGSHHNFTHPTKSGRVTSKASNQELQN